MYEAATARAQQRAATLDCAIPLAAPGGTSHESGSADSSATTGISVSGQGRAEGPDGEPHSTSALTLQQIAALPSPVRRVGTSCADVVIGASPALGDTPQSPRALARPSSSSISSSGSSSALLKSVQSGEVQPAAATTLREERQRIQSQQQQQQGGLLALPTDLEQLPLAPYRGTGSSCNNNSRAPPPPPSGMTVTSQRSEKCSSSAPLALAPAVHSAQQPVQQDSAAGLVAHTSSSTPHSSDATGSPGLSPAPEPPASATVQLLAHSGPVIADAVADVSDGASRDIGDASQGGVQTSFGSVSAVDQSNGSSSSSNLDGSSVGGAIESAVYRELQQLAATTAAVAAVAAAVASQQQ
jgi:hypothetical protein